METGHGLEEERRLCYVGITRAMRTLYLSHAETRRLHGTENHNRPSRFIRELPPNLVSEIRVRRLLDRSAGLLNPVRGLFAPEPSTVNIGQRVAHRKFGEGVVLQCDGHGERTRVLVHFAAAGEKWLMLSVANLQALD